jgi:hypothetical protein
VKRSAVGVLGRFDGYSEVVYEVEGKEYRGRLLPLALAAGGAEAVLVAPESLAVLAFGSAEEAAEALERGELGKVFSERIESAFGARAGVVVAQALGATAEPSSARPRGQTRAFLPPLAPPSPFQRGPRGR